MDSISKVMSTRPAQCMIVSAIIHLFIILILCIFFTSFRVPKETELVTINLSEENEKRGNVKTEENTEKEEVNPPKEAPKYQESERISSSTPQDKQSNFDEIKKEILSKISSEMIKTEEDKKAWEQTLSDEARSEEEYKRSNELIKAHIKARESYGPITKGISPGIEAGLVKGGGSRATQNAVIAGLVWLKRHQNKDGYWDADGFSAMCNGQVCTGNGQDWVDPGVTGLALLAFLGAGNSPRDGEFSKEVKKGLEYLMKIQDKDGCFGPPVGSYMYNHAICTLAISEAYAQTESQSIGKSAQRGTDFLVNAQNPGAGWRYSFRSGGSDTSVTGWCVMALKSAKAAGLNVPKSSFLNTKRWLDHVTDPTTYGVGYINRNATFTMTAVGMTSRIFIGTSSTDPSIISGAKILASNLPNLHKPNYYYWYYGTIAMFQVGGTSWTLWNDSLKETLISLQRKEGCQKGSWPANSAWGNHGGRVYTTALGVLCLEIYYRYPRVFR